MKFIFYPNYFLAKLIKSIYSSLILPGKKLRKKPENLYWPSWWWDVPSIILSEWNFEKHGVHWGPVLIIMGIGFVNAGNWGDSSRRNAVIKQNSRFNSLLSLLPPKERRSNSIKWKNKRQSLRIYVTVFASNSNLAVFKAILLSV